MALPNSYFTRISLGRRLEAGLRAQQAEGKIREWRTIVRDDRIMYEITAFGGVSVLTPGEMADYLERCDMLAPQTPA